MGRIRAGIFECPSCLKREAIPLTTVSPLPVCEECRREMTIVEAARGSAPLRGISAREAEQVDLPSPMRRIRASQVVTDIMSGKSEQKLMAKYDLAPKALQRLFTRLVESNAVPHTELYDRFPLYRAQTDLVESRAFPRVKLITPVLIYAKDRVFTGLVRDVSEQGMRVAGMNVEVGQAETFQLPVDLITKATSLSFDAVCRWSGIRGSKNRFVVAGLELIVIDETNLDRLRKFIRTLILKGSGKWASVK